MLFMFVPGGQFKYIFNIPGEHFKVKFKMLIMFLHGISKYIIILHYLYVCTGRTFQSCIHHYPNICTEMTFQDIFNIIFMFVSGECFKNIFNKLFMFVPGEHFK
jgi:hypothetical protein